MPGGSPAAWPHVAPIFQAIAAKVEDGTPCCDWVGSDGAGHFVKMVHNGIEYGDMQLICEAYQVMSQLLGMGAPRDARGLRPVEPGRPRQLPDRDHARHPRLPRRGREPARRLDPRHRGAEGNGQVDERDGARPRRPAHPHQRGRLRALPLGAQGRAGRRVEGPERAVGGLHRRQGCLPRRPREGALRQQARLVRAGLRAHARRRARVRLEPEVRQHRPPLARRLHHPLRVPREDQGGVRRLAGPPEPPRRPVLPREGRRGAGRLAEGHLGRNPRRRLGPGVHDCAELLRRLPLCERLPANLLQAQRDYFGAHQYERVDRPRGEFFHTNWTGRGGATASSTYGA